MNHNIVNSVLKPVTKSYGGVRIPEIDRTYGNKPAILPNPNMVRIPLSMHIGKPCDPIVSVGDKVQVGQPIADTDALFSAPIHASVSGTVKAIINNAIVAGGKKTKLIEIESDGQMTTWNGLQVPIIKSRENYIDSIRQSGLVGLGGAGFPTSVKFNVNQKIDFLIANGAECEPYNSSDFYTLKYRSIELLDGIKASMHWLNVKKAIIFIEDNKMEAVKILQKILAEKSDVYNNIQIMVVPTMYPRGAEKIVIQMATGRIVPEGKLPVNVNVIVPNVTTLAETGRYLKTGMPLVNRVITVDGNAIKKPQNVLAPIGTEIYEILKFCELDEDSVDMVIMGGPMMGISVNDIKAPLIKMNNAILALTKEESGSHLETECIRCARCIQACPMNLSPTVMYHAIKINDMEHAEKLHVMSCIECGSCSYACPAKIPLVHWFREAKNVIHNQGGKK